MKLGPLKTLRNIIDRTFFYDKYRWSPKYSKPGSVIADCHEEERESLAELKEEHFKDVREEEAKWLAGEDIPFNRLSEIAARERKRKL